MNTNPRRGFTLVEVMIMGAVGLMLLGVVYSFFVSSSTDATKMNRKLQGIQAAHLMLERLEHDLKQAVYVKGVYDLTVYSHQGGTSNAIAFFRVDPTAPPPFEGNPIKLERVEYVFSPVTARVYINGRMFPGGMYKRVSFEFKPGAPDGPVPTYADYVTVTVTGIPDEMANRDISEIDSRDLTTMVTAMSFRPRAMQNAYGSWSFQRGLIDSY